MAEENMIQKAGLGSNQVMIGTVVCGVDEKRVREICDEKIVLALKDLTKEAYDGAAVKGRAMSTVLLDKMRQQEIDYKAFGDPRFQRELVKAQVSAAVSERESDYDLLSELLLARMNGELKIKTKTGISRAIEIVADVDDDELLALTVAFVIFNYGVRREAGVDVNIALHILNDLFSSFDLDKLPKGSAWLENLEMLDTISLSPFSRFNNLIERFANSLDGVVCTGILGSSKQMEDVKTILSRIHINEDILLPNPLLPGYFRLPTYSLHDFSDVILFKKQFDETTGRIDSLQVKPTDEVMAGFSEITKLYETAPALKSKVRENFRKMWNGHSALSKVNAWLESQQTAFRITKVGRAIAYVNAKRIVPNLPTISLE